MSFTDKQREMLTAPMPREHVATREGGGNKALSYIEGHLVMREMNLIFSPGGWGYDCTASIVCEYEADGKNGGKQWRVTYNSRCVLTVPGGVPIADYGTGHGIDRDRGVAHESAIKEAATDSFKRCAKTLGDRLGLALYDKKQANVVDAPEPTSGADAVAFAGLVASFEAVKTRAEWDAASKAMTAMWPTMDAGQQDAITRTMATVKARASSKAAA